LADKKATGKAKKPIRDEDEAPEPKKKGSGSTKALKKSSSARKMPEVDDDDEAPKSKKSSARSSARASSGPPPKQGPDKGKIFLYFVPGAILLLLGLGWYVANLPDAKKEEVKQVNFNERTDEAKKLYFKAKNCFQQGSGIEGEGGLPQLREARGYLQQAHKIYFKVRKDMDAIEEAAKKDPANVHIKEGPKNDNPNAGQSYQFDEDEQLANQLRIMVRKAILERSSDPMDSKPDDDDESAPSDAVPPPAPAPK